MDITPLLSQIAPESPCGPNLEYDPEFGALERAAEYQPERQIGELVEPAKAPEWREVRQLAERLLARTKDLRVAVWWTQARLGLEGLSGFRDGLALIRAWLEGYWEELHPQLDPEDDRDPTMRINALARLVDRDTHLRALRETTLASAPGMGRLSLRDLDIAAGRIPAPPGLTEVPSPAWVNALFAKAPLEALRDSAAAVAAARRDLAALAALLNERVGNEGTLDFAPLREVLARMGEALAEPLARRDPAAGPAGLATGGEQPGTAWQPGQGIENRDQVVAMLDQICGYFRRHEPSSPIPLLLERAKRLVHKDFMDTIRDLAPDGLRQVETIRGPLNEDGD